MREPGNLHPPRAHSSRFPRRRPRPRFLANGVLEYWSIGVLRFVRIAPRDREVDYAPKEHGLIVSPPTWRGARLRPVVETPDFALSLRLREASSGRPGGYVWQAALQYGSSIGWYQAAPGNDPTPCFAHRVYTGGGYNRPIELPHLETFPGAACYQPIELPYCKAAPLQRSARSTRGLFSTLLASFLILQRSGVFGVTRPRPRLRSHEALEVRSVRVLRPVRIAPRDRGVGGAVRAEDLSVLKFVRYPNFPNPNPGKHVNSSILEPNASTISELLVHSAPFSTL
jgi:hypothetical protein